MARGKKSRTGKKRALGKGKSKPNKVTSFFAGRGGQVGKKKSETAVTQKGSYDNKEKGGWGGVAVKKKATQSRPSRPEAEGKTGAPRMAGRLGPSVGSGPESRKAGGNRTLRCRRKKNWGTARRL